jgi:hypothetical protein
MALVLIVPAARLQPSPVADPDPAALVRRLGSSEGAEREAAEKQLKALGAAALPAVTAGVFSSDPEVASRCAAIRQHIREAEARAFIEGKQEPKSAAAWKRFKALVGDSPEARKLFAEMTDDDRRAKELEKGEAGSAEAREAYAAAVDRAQQAYTKAMSKFQRQPISDELGRAARAALVEATPPSEVAAALFLGTHPLPDGAADPPVTGALFKAGFTAGVDGPSKGPFRKLFAAWLDRRRNPDALRTGMDAALFDGLAEAVPPARQLLADKELPPRLIGQALLVVGNFGTRNDLPLLVAFRDDTRTTSTATRPGGASLGATQVRDIAAGMALHLSGQDYEKYGFDVTMWQVWLNRPGEAPFRGVSMFKTDDERAAAHKKAWEWLDQQPKPAPAPPR